MSFGVRRDGNRNELVIDSVVSDQQELGGPTIPDGGYGWVVFAATLFFQATIPSIIVVYGVLMAFLSLETDNPIEVIKQLWDEKLFYAPLFFCTTWTIFDPIGRHLVCTSTWPRLVASAGTCLTCAGLLLLWMGMTGYQHAMFYVFAGVVSGCGASLLMAQCDIIMTQYFRHKHTVLVHLSQAVTAIGFMVVPVIIGHGIIKYSLLKVLLWYQAVILQGLVVCIAFKKPAYLKSRRRSYQYITDRQDDEEDVLSKNSKELQLKRQNSDTVDRIVIEQLGPTTSNGNSRPYEHKNENPPQNWEKFEDDEEDIFDKHKGFIALEGNDEDEEESAPDRDGWEKFENETEDPKENKKDLDKFKDGSNQNRQTWERFEDETKMPKSLELAYGIAKTDNTDIQNLDLNDASSSDPKPLYNNSIPINLNSTYSFDEGENHIENHDPVVFAPNEVRQGSHFRKEISLLKQPTFYKSLLMIVTTKFSVLIFYVLFPPYMYLKIEQMTIKHLTVLLGFLSTAALVFSFASYYIHVKKKDRALLLWILCWMGAGGYFMISDTSTVMAFLCGAIQVVVSICSLQHVGGPLMGLSIRGERSREYNLLSILTGFCFLFFLLINFRYTDIFRFVGMLHFITGSVWFANFVYKKISKI